MSTVQSFEIEKDFVLQAICDSEVLLCLDRMKQMVKEHTLPQVALREEWNVLYQLSQRSTMRERYIMYTAVHEHMKGKFPLLEYIVLMAMLELSNVLSAGEQAQIHRTVRQLLEQQRAVAQEFDDEPSGHRLPRRRTTLLIPPEDQARD